MVGNETDALYALQLDDSCDEYLDEGGYRRAFVVDRIVYKVPFVDDCYLMEYEGEQRTSVFLEELQASCIHTWQEWDNYLKYKDLFPADPFYLPEMTLYTVGPDDIPIIAMPWLIGDHTHRVRDYMHLLPRPVADHLWDICDSNVVSIGKQFHIIDLGC